MNKKIVEVIRNVCLLLVVTLFAFPLFYMVKISLDMKGFKNYVHALTQVQLEQYLKNSFIVAVGTVCFVMLITIPAAFAFSKLKFRFKSFLYLLIIITLMVPGISIVVPLVQIIRKLNLFNNYLSLIFVYTALNSPISLILTKGFMDQLPIEIMESSYIDGCSIYQSFLRIYLPLSKPIVTVVCVLAALASWNEFLFAKLFMSKERLEMVTTIPIRFMTNFYTDIPGLFAALVMIQLPIIILYLCFQKVFREGLTAGAVKG